MILIDFNFFPAGVVFFVFFLSRACGTDEAHRTHLVIIISFL